MKLPIFLLAVACLLPTYAHAQSFDISMGMGSGYARAEYQGKYNHVIMPIMIGGVARLGRIAVSYEMGSGTADYYFAGRPARPGYYYDSSVDRCRNGANGQFAESAYCGAAPGIISHTFELSNFSLGAALPIASLKDGRIFVGINERGGDRGFSAWVGGRVVWGPMAIGINAYPHPTTTRFTVLAQFHMAMQSND